MDSHTCTQCGVAITDRRNPRKQACSIACAALLRRGTPRTFLVPIACETCNATFRPSTRTRRYCSQRCARVAPCSNSTRENRACLTCGTVFTARRSAKQQHCSYRCGAALRRLKARICPVCGGSFVPSEGRTLTCSRSCGRKLTGITRGMASMSASNAKVLLRQATFACEICGWDTEPGVLELHHRDRNRKNNARKNLALVCPNCHAIDHFHAKDGQFANNLGLRRA